MKAKATGVQTHNQKEINVNWTCLQGEIVVPYKTLFKCFGKPLKGDGYKTDAEWELEFEDGTVATIYNYKNGVNYLGRKEGTPKTKIINWHVGGHDETVIGKVIAAIQNALK